MEAIIDEPVVEAAIVEDASFEEAAVEEAEEMAAAGDAAETALINEKIENAGDETIQTEEIAAVEEPENGNEETALLEEENFDEYRKDKYKKIRGIEKGFIEIFDDKSFLTTEYRFSEEEQDGKTEYFYKDGIIISAKSFLWEENDKGGGFKESHTDYYRYNRSAFLRNVERIFFTDRKITFAEDVIRIVFPNNIMSAARDDYFISEKFNAYPEFFGDLFVKKNDRLVYATDERGRILNQTLYRKQPNKEKEGEEEEKIVWAIKNIWSDERILSITKTEGDTVLLATYEYNSSGDCILERNLRNGVLERLVRTEGKRDIEQLYINNALVLQAVYEDGRKISETRMRGR